MTEMTDTTATPRGERTREATDRKLMRATLQIAVDRGISGVTIEEVARRSGVAKTTIYRRYHNADELLHEISAMYLAIPDSDPVPSPRVSISRNYCSDWSIGCATTTSTSSAWALYCPARPSSSSTSSTKW